MFFIINIIALLYKRDIKDTNTINNSNSNSDSNSDSNNRIC